MGSRWATPLSIFDENTAILIRKWPILNQLLLIEQFSGYFEKIEIEIRILKSLWNFHDRFLSKTEPVYTGLNDHVIFHV